MAGRSALGESREMAPVVHVEDRQWAGLVKWGGPFTVEIRDGRES